MLQKLIFQFLLVEFGWRNRVCLFHGSFLRRTERWQMANEQDQLPGGKIVVARRSKSRHSGHAYTVLNDGVQLSVRLTLGALKAQVWRRRVETISIHGVATAVVGVASGTVIGEVITRL